MADQDVKVRENRLRRMAERQGVHLQKSRRRDSRALDYGLWDIVDSRHVRTVLHGVTIDVVEAWLTRDPGQDRQTRQAGLPVSSTEEGTRDDYRPAARR